MANSVTRVGDQTNFTIDQGSSFDHVFNLTVNGEPYDLTGFDARMQIRTTYGATSTIYNATLANGKIVLMDALNGKLRVSFAAADFVNTRFLSKDDETLDCVYDLEIVSLSNKVYKPASGSVVINREVTR